MIKKNSLIESIFAPREKGASPAIIFITSLFLGYYLFFFNVLLSTGTEKISGAITAVFFLGLYIAMLVTGEYSRYRKIFLIAASLLMVPAFINTLIEERGTMLVNADTVINNENPFCHIVFTMTAIPLVLQKGIIFPARLSGHYASIYSMLVIWLSASLIFGRGWCSWVCFYGGWDSCFSSIGKKPALKLSYKNNHVRYFNFVMLAFVTLASLPILSAVYCELLCPFKIVTEFEAPVDIFTIVAFGFMVVTFLTLVVVMPFLTKKRFQCTAFCPFGAMQSLINKISFFRVRFDKEKCTKCGACAAVCPTLSVSPEFLENTKKTMPLTCTMCGECMNVCRQGAITYSIWGLPPLFKIKETADGSSAVLKTLREFLIALVSPKTLFPCAAFLFGTIVSGSFVRETLELIINQIIKLW